MANNKTNNVQGCECCGDTRFSLVRGLCLGCRISAGEPTPEDNEACAADDRRKMDIEQ